MKNVFAAVLFGALMCVGSVRAQDRGGVPAGLPPVQTGNEVAARPGVETWLVLLDGGQFDRSWETAADAVRTAVSKEQWVKILSERRPPLGKLVSRNLKDTRAATSLPGAPVGQYVVVRYDSVFEQKKGVETVTAMLDASGQWKVSGYFFQ